MANEAVHIYDLLKEEGLEAFYVPFQVSLHVKRIQDFKNVSRTDLSRIGIVSGPDLKRFAKVHERASKTSGIRDKLHKVFKSKPKNSHLPHTAAFLQTEPVIIKVSDVLLGNELGRGQFGTVNEGLWKRRIEGEIIQIPVAIKSLGGSLGFNEVSNLTSLDQNHQNIIKFFGIIVDGDAPFKMVTEFAPLGSLSSRLESGYIKSVSILSQFAVQIASGMLYLESKNLVHRDLAARNILVMAHNQVKISDFGLSKLLNNDKEWIMEVEEILPIRWLAPECLLEGKFTTASDVWSYGVTLWEMFTFGQMPWEGLTSKETIDKITKGEHLDEPCFCPRYLYAFILEKCWQQKPEDRSGFGQLEERITWLQPTTGVATTTQQEPDFLEFHVNDLITAIKPFGNDEDLWIGQNETTGDKGKYKKSHTRPMLGKAFANIHENVYRKLKPDVEKFSTKEEDKSCAPDFDFGHKRLRTQSQFVQKETAKEEEEKKRPLSDGLLLEKLQEMIESGHYDVPRSVFDDDDDYVTMKEYLEDDASPRRSGGVNSEGVVIQNLAYKDQSWDSPIVASVTKNSPTDKNRQKPIPPPKPKRLAQMKHADEGSSESHTAATIATQTSLDLSSSVPSSSPSLKISEELSSNGEISPTIDLQSNGIETNKNNINLHGHPENGKKSPSGTRRKQSKDNNPGTYEFVNSEVVEGYARTAVIAKEKQSPPRKPVRSFSKTGLESMMSTLTVASNSVIQAPDELQKSNDTFIKRVSPHSTLDNHTQLQEDIHSYLEEDWYKVPRAALSTTTSHSQKDNAEIPEYVDVDDFLKRKDSSGSSPSSDDDYQSIIQSNESSKIMKYPQDSGKYDDLRYYEHVAENELRQHPVAKRRSSGLGGPEDSSKEILKSKSDSKLSDVRDYRQENGEGNQDKETTKTCGLLASFEAKQMRHASSELSIVGSTRRVRSQRRGSDNHAEHTANADFKPSSLGEAGYQSYSALYQKSENSGNAEWMPGKSPSISGQSKRGFLAKLTRAKSSEEKPQDTVQAGWEPELVKTTTSKETTQKLKLPLTKKRSKKSHESGGSNRNTPALTVEQIPKFLTWIHQNLPELSATTHAELFAALELTRGNMEETIHYLKYRRVLACGIPLTAEMTLDALQQCQWDVRESIICATLMYVVYRFPNIDIDHCRYLLQTSTYSPEHLIRKLTIDEYVHKCEEIGVAEEEAHLTLRLSEGNTDNAIKTMKVRRVSEIVGKSEEYTRDVLLKYDWDIDHAIVFILNTT